MSISEGEGGGYWKTRFCSGTLREQHIRAFFLEIRGARVLLNDSEQKQKTEHFAWWRYVRGFTKPTRKKQATFGGATSCWPGRSLKIEAHFFTTRIFILGLHFQLFCEKYSFSVLSKIIALRLFHCVGFSSANPGRQFVGCALCFLSWRCAKSGRNLGMCGTAGPHAARDISRKLL